MTLDSNIIVAYLDKEAAVVQFLNEHKLSGQPLILSAIVESEILSFPGWRPEQLRAVEQFLEANFLSVPFDRTIARLAAQLRRQYRIRLPDAGIAATAILTNTPLVTRNARDFKHILTLKLIII